MEFEERRVREREGERESSINEAVAITKFQICST